MQILVVTNFAFLGLLVFGFGALSPLAAQTSATLRGGVVDPAGDAVPGASVVLRHAPSGFERRASADAAGRFEIVNIPLQTYELTAASPGFGADARLVELRSNVPVAVEIRLKLAAQLETVDVSVTERAVLVDAQATGTRAELGRSTIDRLPLPPSARGLEAALLNVPGFAANANGAVHPRGAHNQMTYVIDGMPISDQFTGSFATSIDPSLVETIELFTGDVPPEYGAKVSGVANITTRSGFDGGGRRFGSLEAAGAGFDTLSGAARAGGAAGKLGWFGSVSGLKTNRFLDTPSLDNLHNGGNAERAFTRLDYHASPRNVFRFSAMTGRSSFELANLRSQHASGQQQRRRLGDAAASLGYVRLLGPSATFDSTNSYRATAARLTPSAGDTPVTATLDRRLATASSINRLTLHRGRHTVRLGGDYQRFPARERFSFGLTDPGFNDPDGDGFNPNLLAYDLSRGGARFDFHDRGAGSLSTAFAQDKVQLGPLLANLGVRFDRYAFLVRGAQAQPRVGLAYRIDRTGTVLRASYNRNYQTPPNENLLLASSPRTALLAPPEVQRELSGGVIPIQPQRENVYEAGLRQGLGRRAAVDAVYYHKNSRDLQDNDNFLDTGIIFPTSLAQSRVNGFEARLIAPELGRLSLSAGVTHYRAIVTPPFTGGLFLGSAAVEALSEGPFVIDHDQALGASALAIYRGRRWWTSWQARHDSGLVSNPSDPAVVAADPDFFDLLPYVDLESDPPRVRPRTLVDAAIGYEHYVGDRRMWEVVLQVSNLTNRTALYNFQSVFVGTRLVQPRTAGVKLRWYW